MTYTKYTFYKNTTVIDKKLDKGNKALKHQCFPTQAESF